MAGRLQYRLYIGTRAGSIHAFDMDEESGELREIGAPMERDGAGAFLAPSSDGRFLYAIAPQAVAAFSIDSATGALSHINTVGCIVRGNGHIALAGEGGPAALALMAAYHGGGINVVRLREDGGLEEPEEGLAKVHTGGSGVHPETEAQSVAHPHSAFVDATGARALVSDLGQDKIYVYDVDAESARLTERAVIDTAPGSGPRHLCFHPSGPWVYSISELDCTISVISYSAADGELGPILQTVSALPAGYDNLDITNMENADGGPGSGPYRGVQANLCADIHITPDGCFLYGSNRGHDSLVCFSVGRDGLLELVGFTSTRGAHPRSFRIHPSGKWLLVANKDSDNVFLFRVDQRTGHLTQQGEGPVLETKHPQCVHFAVVPPMTWTTVDKIWPDTRGINLLVKVLSVTPVDGNDAACDVVAGDATAVVTLRAKGHQMAACAAGNVLRIQNAKVVMERGFLRLEVDETGALAREAPEAYGDGEPNAGQDVSSVEHDTADA